MGVYKCGPFRGVIAAVILPPRMQGHSQLPATSRNEDIPRLISPFGAGEILWTYQVPPGVPLDLANRIRFGDCETASPLDLESFEAKGSIQGSPTPGVGVEGGTGGTDTLAFYSSPRHVDPVSWTQWEAEQDWGIYLTTGGIETLSREVLTPAGLGGAEAIEIAAGVLHRHELFHHLVDAAIASLELRDGVARYRSHRAAGDRHLGYNVLEEALANAFAIGAPYQTTLDLHLDSGVQMALQGWTRKQPVGYRDAGRFLDKADFRRGCDKLLAGICGTTVSGSPPWNSLLLDTGLQMFGNGDYPLHLIESPGSAHEAGRWRCK